MTVERRARIAELEAERDRLIKEDKEEFKAKAEESIRVLTAGLTCAEIEVLQELLRKRHSEQHNIEYDDDE